MKASTWKKGRGKLGILQPLLGSWVAKEDSPMGKLTCTRIFKPILDGKYIELYVKWDFGKKKYEETAIYGINNDQLSFWSFTSDGKRSEGYISNADDIHPNAICFEANMPAGIARMIFWPESDGSYYWAVESKSKKGWNRFTKHHYKAL